MMTAVDFVTEIKNLAPTREILVKFGLSEDYIEKKLSSYNLKKINDCVISKIEGLKPLDEVILGYNLENFNVGMISFANKLNKNNLGIIIGNFEQDTLVFNPKDFSISMYERNTSHKMCLCAKSSLGFMKAMLIMIRRFSKCSGDQAFADNINEAEKSAFECAKVAGGNETLEFYKMSFGV